MTQKLQQCHIPGQPLRKEDRTTPRYPFTATCDATEPKSGGKIIGRTSDLGPGGCYIDTIRPFPNGANLVVRISWKHQTLKIMAKVIFAQPGLGMGLAFGAAESDQQTILDQWIAELSGEPIAKLGPVTMNSGTSPSENREDAKISETQPLYVVNELILLLLQKGVLTEGEGKSLLQKLFK